jgi:hypothetical protein
MTPKLHPAVFLGAVILLCAAWLWARPPVSAIEIVARGRPRPALVEPVSIELDAAILQLYAGKYEGRGGLLIDVTLKDGKLFAQSVGTIPSARFELRATSETEFFLIAPGAAIPNTGWDLEFAVARDGTVRGFAVNTEYGVIETKRVR